MKSVLAASSNFKSLSIKDLLYARDLYHYHLISKENVVGTAVGLYLIRNDDPYPNPKETPIKKSGPTRVKAKEPRTFVNSGVRDYSWPCVLVFVRKWQNESDFGGGTLHPDEMVPRTLYLPDGRMVPVCVVAVDQGEPNKGGVPDWHWPDNLYGGGMPIVVEAQGVQRLATAGCLVTDGHTVYALTSRHVCGSHGEPVSTIAGGRRVRIGRASSKHLTRVAFEKAYPDLPSLRTYVNLDVGLIELDDVNDWTSQIFRLGPIGAITDLNDHNITLRLIDAPVVASGAASGRLDGQIKALFYRYKSIGGYDYVADFLIAPQQLRPDGKAIRSVKSSQTQPGDSGAVWHLVSQPDADAARQPDSRSKLKDKKIEPVLRPLAIEWGGQVYLDGVNGGRLSFALATSLTTVCASLNVEPVLEHNIGVLPYWGQTGHYSIGSFACQALSNGKLKSFMNDNIDRISFSIAKLTPQEIADRLKAAREGEDDDSFVPLADVPDVVWKQHVSKVTGGRDTRWAGMGRSTGPEHPTHYADIDEARSSDNKTLRELCLDDPNNLSVQFWQQFYDDAGHKEQRSRGLLPFRVWQFFDAMVEFAKNGQADKFLCAAGIVAHYVGDACQPLHGSIYADGYADRPTKTTHHKRDTGEEYEPDSHVGAGVHSTYESKMIDRYAEQIVDGIPKVLQSASTLPKIVSGKDAAAAVVALMDRSAKRVPPVKLVDAYIEAGEKSTVAVQDALWDQFGESTIGVMADGARTLANVWAGAWGEGNGDAIAKSKLGMIPVSKLIKSYTDEKFVESLDLDHIGAVLK